MTRLFALLLPLLALACKSKPPPPPPEPEKVVETGPPEDPNPAQRRVVVLVFEGADPDWVERWRQDLPNLDGLLTGRAVPRLATTTPPQGPVVWSSFATGLNPGRHGVFGFVDRDPATYGPVPGTNDYTPAVFEPDGTMSSGVVATTHRKGTSFWSRAAESGLRAKVLFAPYAWPETPVDRLTMLAGEGLPDLRLTTSTFFLFGTDLGPDVVAAGVSGGELVPLTGKGPYTAEIEGPRDASGAPVRLPVRFEVQPQGGLRITAGDATADAPIGAFSPWVKLTFPLTAKASVSARVRFFPISVGEQARVYMTPLTVAPGDPFLPSSIPADYASTVFERYGDYKSLGWDHDTAALNSGLVPESAFAAERHDLFEKRLAITLGELARRDAELFVATFTGTDRAAHMYLRLGDPTHPAYDDRLAVQYGGVLKETYIDMDRAVGEVRKLLKPGDVMFVVSGHGFHSFKREFNVNTWLLDNGFLTLAPGVTRGDDNAITHDSIDWRKTQAFAMGTGSIYLNLKGRESLGSVPPARASAVLDDLSRRLLALRDGRQHVVAQVLNASKALPGSETTARGPDLIVVMEDSYQTSRATVLGRVPTALFEDNRKRWSGDHASSEAEHTDGLLVTTLAEKLPEKRSILDLGPTALSLLGVAPPSDLDGTSWVAVQPREAAAPEAPVGREAPAIQPIGTEKAPSGAP